MSRRGASAERFRGVPEAMLALGASSVLVATIAAAGVFAFPSAAAVICPACYGFAPDGPRLYVERDGSAEQIGSARRAIADARDRNLAFYGTLRSHPLVFVCLSEACYRRTAGGEATAKALWTFALFLSPRGATAAVASQLLSRMELRARLGPIRSWRGAIPQWFDNGVAFAVAERATSAGAPLSCPAPLQERARDPCGVARWIARNGGPAAAVALIRRVAAGASFSLAYADEPQAIPLSGRTGL